MTDFTVLTINARIFPATAPLLARTGDRVRIRVGNLGAMDHHPLHLHGHRFTLTETDGGTIPESARRPDSAVLVPVGTTRTFEFIADNPGDWAFHCHMTHHVMNQMGHNTPNMTGVDAKALMAKAGPLLPGYMAMGQAGMADMGEMGMPVPPNSLPMVGGQGPFDYITMGGMFTILKVRDQLPAGGSDPGWYAAPEGTTASLRIAGEARPPRDLTGLRAAEAGVNRAALPAIDPGSRPATPAQQRHHGHRHRQ